MNSHTGIKRLLAAYCGGDLQSHERALVEQHLEECRECRSELADLQITVDLLRTTPAVEPPPWMTARIMAHIHEQKQKPVWLQRFLLLPLRMKLPLEITALLVVCVSGYILSKSVDTELKKTPAVLQESPGIPPQIEKGTDREIQRIPAPSRFDNTLPPPVTQDIKDRPAAAPAAAPPAYAPQPPAFTQKIAPPPSGSGAVLSESAPAADSAARKSEALPAARSRNVTGTVRSEAETAAPAPAMKSVDKATVSPFPQLTVRLTVTDRNSTADTLRAAAARSGALVLNDSGPAAGRITVRIPPQRLQEFYEIMSRAGRVDRHPLPDTGAELVDVTIFW